MKHPSLFIILLCLPSLSTAAEHKPYWRRWMFWRRADRNVPPEGYHNPYKTGGSLLTQVEWTNVPGQGEPVNTIISGNSDQDVLKDQEVDGGLRNYFLSLHFSGECLGQHAGSSQKLDLGDGNGPTNETAVIRYNYFDPSLGACTESIKGGNHFRYWVQNGPSGNSGAVFMAVSYEAPISRQHTILPNGYNLGRDYLVGNITNVTVPTTTLNDTVKYSSWSKAGGYTYVTDVSYVSGMLQNSSVGINHNETVKTPESEACDGLVAVLQVKITERPTAQNAANSISTLSPIMKLIPASLILVASFVLFPLCL